MKTKVQELKELQKQLDADPNFVDFKCTPAGDIFLPGGSGNHDATDEEIARDVLILVKGNGGVDISDEIL